MKYFKPELLARFRSRSEHDAASVEDKWDHACDTYLARLKNIRAKLPRDARGLIAAVSLHDAKVLNVSIGRGKKPFFAVRLQLEGFNDHPGEVLDLIYHPVAPPMWGVSLQSHPSLGKKPLWVLCDEWDLDRDNEFFIHRLLLTGLEIEFVSMLFPSSVWNKCFRHKSLRPK